MKSQIIYVCNLPESYDENTIEQLFSAYGKVTKVSSPIDRKTGRPKGYAFITFTNMDAAERALEKNNAEIDGQVIVVEYAKAQTLTDIASYKSKS